MEDVIHEPAGEDNDTEMEETHDLVSPNVDAPIATIETDIPMEEYLEERPVVQTAISAELAMEDAPTSPAAVPASNQPTIDTAVDVSMVQAPAHTPPQSPAVLPPTQTAVNTAAVNVSVVRVPTPLPPQVKPTPGPNQRVIINPGSQANPRWSLITLPALSDDGGLTQQRKRKWEGPHDGSSTHLCTLADVRETFARLVQGGYATLREVRSMLQDQEAPVLKQAFMFDQLTAPVATRTFTIYGWRTTRVTTFDNFLRERALRRSGGGPWSEAEAVRLIREYLICRLPETNSTHAVLVHLARCASVLLGQVVARKATCQLASTRQRLLGDEHHAAGSFSRAYATPLYHQLQDRLFMWMTSFEPARTGKVDFRTLHAWATGVKQRCRRTKGGQVQDVWRVTDTADDRRVVASWVPTGPGSLKPQRDAKEFFLAWVDHLVGPTLAQVAGGDEGLARQCVIGLRQQVEDEVDRWAMDFPAGARKDNALQDIIAKCAKGGR